MKFIFNKGFALNELKFSNNINFQSVSYAKEQITHKVISEIKKYIMEGKIDNVYASDIEGHWFEMEQIGEGWVTLTICCTVEKNGKVILENYFNFFNEKYLEGNMEDFLNDEKNQEIDKEDIIGMYAGQDPIVKYGACDDFELAANIFEEWALTGRIYPATWIDNGGGVEIYCEVYRS